MRAARIVLRPALAFALALAAAPAGAQGAPDLTGVYAAGGETLHLSSAGDEIAGRYVAPERTYLFEGWLEDGFYLGLLVGADAPERPLFYFIARADADAIQLALYAMDEEGEPDLSAALRASTLRRVPGRQPEFGGGAERDAAPAPPAAPEPAPAAPRSTPPAGAGSFHGPFHGDDGNGGLALLELRQQGDALEGVMEAGGARAELAGRIEGAAARGRVTATDAAGTFSAAFEGAVLRITFSVEDGEGRPHTLSFRLERGAPKPLGALDPRLVGTWVKSSSYTSGDFSVATSQTCVIRGDGTLTLYDSRMAGGGSSGSFDSGSTGGGQTSRWHTRDNLLYVNGQLYARFGFNGSTLGLWFSENGKPEIWSRQ